MSNEANVCLGSIVKCFVRSTSSKLFFRLQFSLNSICCLKILSSFLAILYYGADVKFTRGQTGILLLCTLGRHLRLGALGSVSYTHLFFLSFFKYIFKSTVRWKHSALSTGHERFNTKIHSSRLLFSLVRPIVKSRMKSSQRIPKLNEVEIGLRFSKRNELQKHLPSVQTLQA